MSEPYDWVDDDTMSAEETMRRFRALNPKPTTGPPSNHPLPATVQSLSDATYVVLTNYDTAVTNLILTFKNETTEAVMKPATSGSLDERTTPAPTSTPQRYEPRQPVLVGGANDRVSTT